MYDIISKIWFFNMSLDIQFNLYDKFVLPDLLYYSEIWGYENIDVIERVHLRFLKQILNLKSSILSFMVYGKTRRFSLYIIIYTRMIEFWV